MSKPKPKRSKVNPLSHFADKSRSPLPREQLEGVGFVYDPRSARLICPWPRGPLDWRNETTLLAVLARVDGLEPAGPVWVWADPLRLPVPVEAPDLPGWLERWAEGRQSYVARCRAA